MSAETQIKNPVQLTEGAMQEIRRLRSTQGLESNSPLRIGVKGGGCAGFSYILEFDKQNADDEVYEMDDIRVVVDMSHLLYLTGIEIDFASGLNNRGFTFNNPNATKTCGCGSSFA